MDSLDSRGYELVVKSLLEAKLRAEGLATLEAFHRKKYRGKSGHEHEIDVSFEIKLGELELLFVVECKHYIRKVGIEDIMALSYGMKDIGAHKGLLVTSSGFQPGTTAVAKAERIALLVAAKGRLAGWWMGLYGVRFVFWIDRIVIAPSTDGADFQVLGQRHVAHNETWCALPLDAPEPADKGTRSQIYFLLPEEEPLLGKVSGGSGPDSAERPSGGFARHGGMDQPTECLLV